MKKLWGGRFKASTNEQVEQFTESVSFDQRLALNDIRGSLAHARMLAAQGIISQTDCDDIVDGLNQIRTAIEEGKFDWSSKLEDVHMNIESKLTELKGDAGKRLHTGRSRNDQVGTDIRLYLRDVIDTLCNCLDETRRTFATLALENADAIMPGFTHMQAAQPTTIGHHLLAWQEMLKRDKGRLLDCRQRLNECPLGAAALCGTSYPIDRDMTSKELGFNRPTRNSLDTVSDRDFAMEFLNAAAIGMVHLSRISEELVLWTSPHFDFIDLGDAYCTGSSIMPQKKNPDIAELIRGKSARMIGNATTLLTLMKGQPLAYNRDNQEDKEPLFDSADHWLASIVIVGDMMAQAEFKKDNMRTAAEEGYSTATDLADYLVVRGIPFRDAHEVVGNAVALAIKENKRLDELTLEQFRGLSDLIAEDVYTILSVDGSVAARDHVGGTAPNQVRIQARLVLKEFS